MNTTHQVSKDTWGRMGLLLVALVNQILTMLGKNPLAVSENDVYLLFTLLFTASTAIWGFWKNNSFTQNALIAQAHLNQLKQGASAAPADPVTTPAEPPVEQPPSGVADALAADDFPTDTTTLAEQSELIPLSEETNRQ